MEILKTTLWVVQIITALTIIILVLLQHGKGADAGATFGSSGSSSLFGASGSANFLSRATAICATIFFATTLGLVVVSSKGKGGDLGVMTNMELRNDSNASMPAKINANSSITKANNKLESVVQIPE